MAPPTIQLQSTGRFTFREVVAMILVAFIVFFAVIVAAIMAPSAKAAAPKMMPVPSFPLLEGAAD